jgi:hypothetical protein
MKSFIKCLFPLLMLMAFSTQAAVIPATLYGDAEDGSELWTFTDGNNVLDDAGFYLNAQFGGHNTSDREFGMYQYDINNNSMINQLMIFNNTTIDSGSGTANVLLSNLTQTVSTSYGSIDTSLAQGLGFGFYFKSDGFTSYSQAAFNGGGVDFFGFYRVTDPFSTYNTHLYAADNDTGGNLDWLKMSISDVRTGGIPNIITSVPEPSTIALMGLALVGFSLRKYKKV